MGRIGGMRRIDRKVTSIDRKVTLVALRSFFIADWG